MQLLPTRRDPPDGPPRLRIVSNREAAPTAPGAGLVFKQVYEDWFGDVVKWLYALGAPAADTEDLAQEIFLVVRRQLPRFRGGNLAGWLYEISRRTVRDHRRRAWFRNLVLRRQDIDFTQMPTAADG